MENNYYKNNKELINIKRDNYQNHLNFKDLNMIMPSYKKVLMK